MFLQSSRRAVKSLYCQGRE